MFKVYGNNTRHSNTGLVSSGITLTSWEEGDGMTTKRPYWVDVLLHQLASHPIFSYWVG